MSLKTVTNDLLMNESLVVTDITANAKAMPCEGYFLEVLSDEAGTRLCSHFGGKTLVEFELRSWDLNRDGDKKNLGLNAMVFEHGRFLVVETFFIDKDTQEYMGSSKCYRLNIAPDEYVELLDDKILESVFNAEMGA